MTSMMYNTKMSGKNCQKSTMMQLASSLGALWRIIPGILLHASAAVRMFSCATMLQPQQSTVAPSVTITRRFMSAVIPC